MNINYLYFKTSKLWLSIQYPKVLGSFEAQFKNRSLQASGINNDIWVNICEIFCVGLVLRTWTYSPYILAKLQILMCNLSLFLPPIINSQCCPLYTTYHKILYNQTNDDTLTTQKTFELWRVQIALFSCNKIPIVVSTSSRNNSTNLQY